MIREIKGDIDRLQAVSVRERINDMTLPLARRLHIHIPNRLDPFSPEAHLIRGCRFVGKKSFDTMTFRLTFDAVDADLTKLMKTRDPKYQAK